MRKPLRVLVLEDSASAAELNIYQLRRAGIDPQWQRVETEADYLAALDRSPDLILADYSLPQFDGLRAVDLLRARGLDTPFILISGTVGEEIAVEAMKRGVSDYLLKDRIARLGTAVQRALEAQRLREQARRLEKELREQAALLDLTSDAILVRDLSHRVTYWNKGAECLYGWTATEAIGKGVTDLHAPVAWEGREAAHKVLLEQGAWQGEIPQRTKAGKALVVHSQWTLMRTAEGVPQAVLVINRDMTEKKQLDAQCLRRQRMESIGSLASGIAHDLNNALAPIVMASEFLKMTCKDAETNRVLDTICDSARRGAGMVKQILTFARGSEGERGEVQPKHLVIELIGITRHTFPQTIQIHTDVAPKVWTLVGNPTQLHQILLNLCVNARDAMPQGGVLTLAADNVQLSGPDARRTPGAKPGPYVMLSVTDTGTGMTPAVRTHIFDAFFTTKTPDKGTGLGLSTVQNIVKDHGGFLTVDSEVGRGTTFKVYLPAQETTTVTAVAAAPPVLPMGHGELILVVDDEAAIRSIASHTLQAFDYRVLTANDGAQAVALCARNMGDLQMMITDMAMPIMDGQATIRAVRTLLPRLPIIAASGSDSLVGPSLLKQLDAQGYLRKPFSADNLIRTVHEVLHSPANGSPPV